MDRDDTRIEELRREIEKGEYSVPPLEVAEAILEFHRRNDDPVPPDPETPS